LSEALLPASVAHHDSCAALAVANREQDASADGDLNATASSAALLVEALRKKRGVQIAPEIAAAQDSLERRIRAHLSRGRVSVTLTDNRYTMISVRRIAKERRFEVRLHYMFADADPVITRALAHYIAENDGEASRVLGEFIDQNAGHVRGRARRQPTQVIFTAGEFHDLRTIYDDLNARYFENKIDAAITWGQRTGRPRTWPAF